MGHWVSTRTKYVSTFLQEEGGLPNKCSRKSNHILYYIFVSFVDPSVQILLNNHFISLSVLFLKLLSFIEEKCHQNKFLEYFHFGAQNI